MAERMRWIRLSLLVVLMVVAAQGAAWAVCGNCQVCRERTRITLAADFCAVANGENGSMCCSEQTYGPQTFCTESGSACYGIIVGGGGGGGGTGGGGGGGCGSYGGFCPAECFSCGGGGGAN